MTNPSVFTLDITDNETMANVRQEIEATTGQRTRAMRRALNKTARWLQGQSVKAIGPDKQIPAKLLRRRLSVLKAQRQGESLTAYLVANLVGVRACDLGHLRQTARGAKAGKRFFQGSFVARMPQGHRGAYRRTTGASLPIREERVSLEPEASSVILALLHEKAMARFERVFAHELEFASRMETPAVRHAGHARGTRA